MRRSTRLPKSLPESLAEEPLVGCILRGMLWKVMCAPASSLLLQHTSEYVSIRQRMEAGDAPLPTRLLSAPAAYVSIRLLCTPPVD